MSLVTRRYAFPDITAAKAFLSDLAANVDNKLETHAIFAPDKDGKSHVLIALNPEQAEHAPNFVSRNNGVLIEEVAPPKPKPAPAEKEKKTPQEKTELSANAAAQKDKYKDAPRCRFCKQPYLDIAKHEAKRHPNMTPPDEKKK